ncbi:MAG: septum formation initiator family protein [Oscillospiraceae bacterium]|nr:septum formation initiator family protein [Oscillospiraceae bacterium]
MRSSTRRRNIRLLKKTEQLLHHFSARKRAWSLVILTVVPIFVLTLGIYILKERAVTQSILEQNMRLEDTVRQMRAENAEYEAILANDDPAAFEEFVIRTARERLGLSMPGDKVFIDPATVQASK